MAESNSGELPQPTSLKEYILADSGATTLFSMRVATVVCTLIYIISTLGILGGLAYGCYLNAMLAAFFTFSIRLLQRKKQFEINLFSRRMLDLFSSEDSGHYMLYSFFYYHQPPLSIYLFPLFLYAILYTVNYTQGILPFLPGSVQRLLTQWNTKVVSVEKDIKRFIVYTEIFILFVVVWNTILGMMFILAPFLHYHFLRLRYQSRRNPFVRIAFSDLRMSAEYLSRHPRCPAPCATLINKSISLVSRLAPTEQMREA